MAGVNVDGKIHNRFANDALELGWMQKKIVECLLEYCCQLRLLILAL